MGRRKGMIGCPLRGWGNLEIMQGARRWFGVLLVEPLNRFHIGQLPLGFWFGQQGSIYVFVVLIFVYAWRMDRLDRRFGVDE